MFPRNCGQLQSKTYQQLFVSVHNLNLRKIINKILQTSGTQFWTRSHVFILFYAKVVNVPLSLRVKPISMHAERCVNQPNQK